MKRMDSLRASLAVRQLRLCASKAGDTGLIPSQGTKIPHAPCSWPKFKKRERERENRQPKSKPSSDPKVKSLKSKP